MIDPMQTHTMLRNAHDAIVTPMREATMKHLALVWFKEGDVYSEHVRCLLNDSLRKRYLVKPFPTTEHEFDTWEGKKHILNALILDTMNNVQSEMLGHDDSWADYMPDGITQIALYTADAYDGNGFLWYCLNNLYKCCQDVEGYNDEDAEEAVDHITAVWDAYMQDCTSGLLYDLSVAYHARNN